MLVHHGRIAREMLVPCGKIKKDFSQEYSKKFLRLKSDKMDDDPLPQFRPPALTGGGGSAPHSCHGLHALTLSGILLISPDY